MTDEKEQQPFLTCLVHETKKAYLPYLKGVAVFIVMCGIGYALLQVGEQILGVFENILALTAIVPWWVYAILPLILAPAVYALYVCIRRRASPERQIIICIAGWIIMIVLLTIIVLAFKISDTRFTLAQSYITISWFVPLFASFIGSLR